ncbi:MAG: hypothetical protein KF856_11930 [Cyclobacteriaceae bacterium]|nr:hypothetical protein [Cyclobacteriaceae bacterium]
MKEKELDDLAMLWQEAKTIGSEQPKTNATALIATGKARKKSTLAAHYGNATVLTLTVLVLVFYFYYLYNFQDVLSKIGYNLMIGGLTIRVIIELFSAWRSRKIKIEDTASASLQNSVAFFQFRKRIHGPITIFIFVAYFIGFYMLTPEFYRRISLMWLVLMDTSALIVAAVLVYFIRRGIRQELHDLEKMVELQRSLIQSE